MTDFDYQWKNLMEVESLENEEKKIPMFHDFEYNNDRVKEFLKLTGIKSWYSKDFAIGKYRFDIDIKSLYKKDSFIKNKICLDAGCGSARMLRLLSEKHNANFIGIDLSSSLYDAASIKSINLIRGDLLKLPFKDNYFDFIFSGGVLHHTGNPQRAFKNLVKSLKPKGKIYIWLYSVEQGIFGKVRKFLPGIYKISNPVLYYLCWLFAFPIYLGGILFSKFHSFSEIRFKLFDHLSPKYRSVHTENEVIHWFKENNLINIEVIISQVTGGVGILGEKA